MDTSHYQFFACYLNEHNRCVEKVTTLVDGRMESFVCTCECHD